MAIFFTGQNSIRAGSFIISEDRPYSRDQIIVQSGAGFCPVGTVLGKITASGKFVPSPAAGSDGSEVACAILFDEVDATSTDATAVTVSRSAQVIAEYMLMDETVGPGDIQAKYDQLRDAGIVVRG